MKIMLALLLAIAAPAAAEVGRPQLDQDVFKDTMTVTAVTIGTTFSRVDTPLIEWSWLVEVQNLSTEQICCTPAAERSGTAAGACVRIDTASTGARPSASDWKRWKRWAQNLAIYCRTLKSANGSTADIIVTQGR